MNSLRRAILWSVLGGIFILIVLSAVGALIGSGELGRAAAEAFPGHPWVAHLFGPQRPKELFNSWPLVIFWFAVAGLLAAGLAAFRRLVAAPAGLAMHLGALLVIAGAMWGSDKGHAMREALFGTVKVPSAYMPIMEGATEDRLFADDLQTPLAALPFGLHLRDFTVEHYPSDAATWALLVVAPTLDAEGNVAGVQEQLRWRVGEELAVPHSDARLTVLRYLPHARPAYAEGVRPHVEVALPGGERLALDAEVGRELTIRDAPPMRLKVVRVFSNLRVLGTGPGRRVIDAPGEGDNPAAQVQVIGPEGVWLEGYALAMETPVRSPDGELLANLRFSRPQPSGAEDDPASDAPAMELLLSCGGRQERRWLIVPRGAGVARLALAPIILGRETADDDMAAMMAPDLYLVRPVGPVSDYKSDLEVREGGRTVARRTVEVNDPLHYGGYHFYQYSYDSKHEAYTVLSAVSDSGLAAVYLGMALLALGAFGRFWAGPCRAFFSPKGNPNQTANSKRQMTSGK